MRTHPNKVGFLVDAELDTSHPGTDSLGWPVPACIIPSLTLPPIIRRSPYKPTSALPSLLCLPGHTYTCPTPHHARLTPCYGMF